MTEGPPAEVLASFGCRDRAVLLEGGQGEAFLCGDLVLKPADDRDETSWVAELVSSLVVDGVRVADPVHAKDGSWVVGGWAATRWLAGMPGPEGRLAEVLAVCDRVNAGLVGASRPGFIDRRAHRWAVADRVAWDEAGVPAPAALDPLVRRLRSAVRSIAVPSQLVHGDLCGNVLFHEALPPAVIDWSLYWRPAAYARAVVVVDGLLWYGADEAIARSEAGREHGGQLLVRALLFRLVVDAVSRSQGGPGSPDADGHAALVDLVVDLADG